MAHSFAQVRFVRSNENLSNTGSNGEFILENSSSSSSSRKELTGQEARSFYTSLFSTCNICSLSSLECECTSSVSSLTDVGQILELPREESSKIEKAAPIELRNRFLRFSAEGNVPEMEKYLETNPSLLNCVDEFGWSALMCAAYEGRCDVVKFLLLRGADYAMINQQNRTALNVARRRGHRQIVDLILMAVNGELEESEPAESDQVEVVDEFYCEVCAGNFRDSTHQTSTVHLLKLASLTKENDDQRPSYLLPQSNKGFQLMLKEGWDAKSGLGRQGQGRWYPVKTTLKRDRRGLGTKGGPKPRVTHFTPHDLRAIQKNGERNLKLQRETKRERAKRDAEYKQKIKNFRRMFY